MADNAEKHKGEEESRTSRLAGTIAQKANKIKYVVLALVIVLIAAMVVFSQQRRAKAAREAEAENKIFQAEVDLANTPENDGIPVFGKLGADYASLPAGARAYINQFAIAFNTRDFAKAETAARDLLKSYPKNIMASRVRLALAQSLLMQDKTTEAQSIFRDLAQSADFTVMPAAKLALAQSLERDAEAVKDNPDEYRRRLEAAEAEYNDIIVRSQISVPSQRGFWPQAVTLPADFSLVVIKDKLAGYRHEAPVAAPPAPAAVPGEFESVMNIPPPPPESEEEVAEETPETPAAEEKEPEAERPEGEEPVAAPPVAEEQPVAAPPEEKGEAEGETVTSEEPPVPGEAVQAVEEAAEAEAAEVAGKIEEAEKAVEAEAAEKAGEAEKIEETVETEAVEEAKAAEEAAKELVEEEEDPIPDQN